MSASAGLVQAALPRRIGRRRPRICAALLLLLILVLCDLREANWLLPVALQLHPAVLDGIGQDRPSVQRLHRAVVVLDQARERPYLRAGELNWRCHDDPADAFG